MKEYFSSLGKKIASIISYTFLIIIAVFILFVIIWSLIYGPIDLGFPVYMF